jgi:hypothetical protein
MPYQHLGAPYESAVTDRHTIWLEGVTMHETGFFQFLIFLDEKKGNGVGLGPGGHIPIFVAKSFVECAQSKLCRLIGCAEVLVGHSILGSVITGPLTAI